MDRQAVDRAFRLANKAIDFEEDAENAHARGDIVGFQRLRRYASEHYSQAVEQLLSQKGSGKCAATIHETVLVLMARLEGIVTPESAPVPLNTPAGSIDPVKDEKRKKVAVEILETERTYYLGLRNLIEYYEKPFRTEGVLTEDEESIVFAGCTQIAALSEQMIASFSAKISEWNARTTTLGDVFSLYAEFLKMYIPFASNFAHGQTILETKTFDQVSQRAASHSVPNIAALRILPIQRLPRYVLLVNELLKQTTDGHADKALLEKALREIKVVAAQVNARMQASEMEAKVLEIQSNLWTATGSVPELVAPGRIFVKEGPVTKVRSNGSLKRNYYLFGFNDLVVYATTNPLFRNKYHFHKAIDYYGAFPADDEVRQQGIQLKYGESAFKITGSNGYRIFVVSSDSERRSWLKALTDSVDVKEAKRKSWGRARGELLGDDDDDDEFDN